MQQGIRKTGSTHGWRLLRQRILTRDEHTCQMCGQTEGTMHVDHILERRNGGSDTHSNLRTLCERCNLRRPRTRRPVLKRRNPMTTTQHPNPFTRQEYTV